MHNFCISTDSDSVMVRASASEAAGHVFDPGPGHTKDFKKKVPVATLLGSQHYKASTGFSQNKIWHRMSNMKNSE